VKFRAKIGTGNRGRKGKKEGNRRDEQVIDVGIATGESDAVRKRRKGEIAVFEKKTRRKREGMIFVARCEGRGSTAAADVANAKNKPEDESDEIRVVVDSVEAAEQEQEAEEEEGGCFLQSRPVAESTTDGNVLALPPPCLQRLSTEKGKLATAAKQTANLGGKGRTASRREEFVKNFVKGKRCVHCTLIDGIAPQKNFERVVWLSPFCFRGS